MKGLLAGGLAALCVMCGASGAAAAPWEYTEIKDPITDAARGIAVLSGNGGSLAVKCDSNGPDSMYLHIISEKFLGAVRDKYRSVIMRLDDGALQNLSWYHDGRSAILTDNKKVAALTPQIVAAKKVVFRLTTYDSDSVDIVLEGDGNPAIAMKAFATCGQAWPAATQ